MKTIVYHNEIGESSYFLDNGGLVAVPTETVYGLACNGLNESAVKHLYDVKGRPPIKPISLMVHSFTEVEKYAFDIPNLAYEFAEKFWPGPLTIILNSNNIVPNIVRANGNTIGFRCPENILTLNLLKSVNYPLAVPSANPSGKESPKDANKVSEYFDGKIDVIIDGGKCELGFESTIIDFSNLPYRILRYGSLSLNEIKKFIFKNTKIIGITGGTGSGKTTLLNFYLEDNALIIDCDNLYHELLISNENMISEIKDEFIQAFENNVLNRKILADIAFNNPDKLALLNKITHKYIIDDIKDKIFDYVMNGGKLVVIDAIELFSTDIYKYCNYTIGVIANLELRIDRIMARDELTYQEAMQRINAQKVDEYYINKCSYIVENNTSENDLKNKYLNEVRYYE